LNEMLQKSLLIPVMCLVLHVEFDIVYQLRSSSSKASEKWF
jgi:hypothetical protein